MSRNRVSVDPVITSANSGGNRKISDRTCAHCPKCGTPLKPDLSFCTNCGTSIDVVASSPVDAEAAHTPGPRLYPMPSPSVGRQTDAQPAASCQVSVYDSRDDRRSAIRILLGCAAALYVVLTIGLSGTPLDMLWNALAGLLGVLLVLVGNFVWKRIC